MKSENEIAQQKDYMEINDWQTGHAIPVKYATFY